jgi:hypothetical protein
MRILAFNSKGGCGKSLLAREVIAAPNAKQTVIIEIDTLNKTQLTYQKDFKEVIELDKENIQDLLIHLNEHDDCVVDVGADNLTATLNTLVKYQLFNDIDLVVIPMTSGRTDCENALKTYATIKEFTDKIIFAFSRFNEDEKLEDQYQVFFNNAQKAGIKSIENNFITVTDSDIFLDAQNQKELVVNLAKEIDYKKQALNAKKDDDIKKFHELMKKELHKRAAKILIKDCIMPAHQKIMSLK